MDIFKKPYSQEIFQKKSKTLRYPYSDEFFKSAPTFTSLVFDGGAFFLIKELMGSKDPNGRDLFEFISSGDLFKFWNDGSDFDWDISYKQFKKSSLPIDAEHHVWINRLYFLLPLAQEFLETGDESWVEKWFYWLNDWYSSHPYQELDDRPHQQTDYTWRDMQVAWRLLVLLHSIKMLGESKYLDKEKWVFIYDCVELHASHLYKEGNRHINNENAHNHVLQIGLVLLMTGVLFPENTNSDEYIEAGRKIIEINLKKHIFNDGGSIEGCPSYSHFIARMYLEVFLLLEKNNLKGIKDLEASIKNQYEWLNQMTPPSGKSLQIGDSYALNAKRDLEVVKGLMDLNLRKRESTVFKDSRFISLRNDRFDIFIDAMDRTQGHQHYGRPHVVAYYNQKPLIIDTGCCVYDRKTLRDFQMSPVAHNTMVIKCEETGEILNIDSNIEIKVADSEFSREKAWVILETKGEYFTWTRKIEIAKDKLEIFDKIDSPQQIKCELFLHFTPDKLRALSSSDAVLFFDGEDIGIKFKNTDNNLKVYVEPAMDDKNEFFYSSVLSNERRGENIEFNVVIE